MPGKHRLYMHCPGLCEDQLYTYLQQFGRVTDIYLPKGLDGQGKGYGFASFENAEGLSAALAAGDEHSIQGKTVRVNRAGPRPALHLQSSSDPGRSQSASNIPLAGGVSRQRGGFSLSEPPSSGSMFSSSGNEGPASGSGGLEGGGPSRSGRPQGAGPRIYVGGIPNAVSETMVRKYFSSWGKVEDVYFPKERATGRRRPFCFVTFASQKAAEKAVAQSNREINGYQVASISMTADRIAHYQQVIGGEELQRVLQEPAHPFALSLQGLFPQLAAAQTQQPGLSALGESMVLDHQTGVPTLGVDDPLGPFLGLGGHMDYHFNDLSLQPSVLQMGQPHLAHQHMQQQQHGLQQGQQLQNGGPPGAPAHPQLSGNSLLQPRFQEALLAANLGGQDMSNPRLLSPGVGAPAFSRLDLLSQQQAMAHQHGHQTVGGQHVQVQPDQQLGRGMASYNSCPLDVDTVLRAQLAAATGVHHPSLAQKLPPGPLAGQVTGSDAANTNQAQQDFNPTVRRPADGFGEAPSAFQEPLREPYLFSRVDLHGTPSHAPSHAVLPNPGSLHPAPF